MTDAAPAPELVDREGSLIARLDPRTRLLCALAFVIALVPLHDLISILAALGFGLLAVALARLPLAALAHRLLHIEGFLVVLVVLLPFTVPGEALFTLGPLVATGPGALKALFIVLKVNAAALTLFALVASLEPVRLGQALAALGLPERLVHLFLMTVRYVAVFRKETLRLLDAMRARGFEARSNWHSWRSLGHLAGMLLVRSLDRAERVQEAMNCRGFSGRLHFTPSGRPTWLDAAFALCVALVVTTLGVVGYST